MVGVTAPISMHDTKNKFNIENVSLGAANTFHIDGSNIEYAEATV